MISGQIPLYVDSDNALGSPKGDVDDGFALAALLLAGAPVAAIASIFGNTTEPLAYQNNRTLARLCGFTGPVLRGCGTSGEPPSEASRFLLDSSGPLRILALGPLTNIAAALQVDPSLAGRIVELVFVGANAGSWGRWPPYWPFEVNLVHDRAATRTVAGSGIPLTIVPLDVAVRMTATLRDLAALPGPVGEHLRREAGRWFRLARLYFWSGRIPVWDLLAVFYALEPGLLQVAEVPFRFHRNTWFQFGAGDRRVRLVQAFDRDALWARFQGLLPHS